MVCNLCKSPPQCKKPNRIDAGFKQQKTPHAGNMDTGEMHMLMQMSELRCEEPIMHMEEERMRLEQNGESSIV